MHGTSQTQQKKERKATIENVCDRDSLTDKCINVIHPRIAINRRNAGKLRWPEACDKK